MQPCSLHLALMGNLWEMKHIILVKMWYRSFLTATFFSTDISVRNLTPVYTTRLEEHKKRTRSHSSFMPWPAGSKKRSYHHVLACIYKGDCQELTCFSVHFKVWNLNWWHTSLFRLTSSYYNHIIFPISRLLWARDEPGLLQKQPSLCMKSPSEMNFYKECFLMQALIWFDKYLEVLLKHASAYYFLGQLKETWRIRLWRIAAWSHSVYLKSLA